MSEESNCAECGMRVRVDEYHPYAACLMFRGCHDTEAVRSNLLSVQASGAQAEFDLRNAEQQSAPVAWHRIRINSGGGFVPELYYGRERPDDDPEWKPLYER